MYKCTICRSKLLPDFGRPAFGYRPFYGRFSTMKAWLVTVSGFHTSFFVISSEIKQILRTAIFALLLFCVVLNAFSPICENGKPFARIVTTPVVKAVAPLVSTSCGSCLCVITLSSPLVFRGWEYTNHHKHKFSRFRQHNAQVFIKRGPPAWLNWSIRLWIHGNVGEMTFPMQGYCCLVTT